MLLVVVLLDVLDDAVLDDAVLGDVVSGDAVLLVASDDAVLEVWCMAVAVLVWGVSSMTRSLEAISARRLI